MTQERKLNRKLNMDDKLIIYNRPLTNRLIACLEAEAESQAPYLREEGFIEYARMTVKEFIAFGQRNKR